MGYDGQDGRTGFCLAYRIDGTDSDNYVKYCSCHGGLSMKQLLSLVAMMSLLSFVGCGESDPTPATTPEALALVGDWVAVMDDGTIIQPEWGYVLNADGTGTFGIHDSYWSARDGLFTWGIAEGWTGPYQISGNRLSLCMNGQWQAYVRR